MVQSNLTHPNLTLNRSRQDVPRLPFISVISGLCTDAQFCSFSNCIDNAYSACMERVYYHIEHGVFVPPYVPDVETVFTTLNAFFDSFCTYVTTTVPESFSVYPEHNYRGRKLRLYQRARDRVMGRPMWSEIQRWAYIKGFVKIEKILIKPKRIVPRLIQPRSPEYNVCVGRFIRQLEHPIYTIINKMLGGTSVMKGLNCFQQGRAIAEAWEEFSDPVAIMLDAVRFDQHVSSPMLQWEHRVYSLFFQGPDRCELNELLKAQLHNKGCISCCDGLIKYHTDGCRASGDMNTAMGNVIIMCGIIYSFIRQLRIKARLINNGDDCCLIVERGEVGIVTSTLPQYFKKLGFIIDIEGTTNVLEGISFCQTHPVYDGHYWRMVRDPSVAISKDVTICKKWTLDEYECFLSELGLCGYTMSSDIPIFSSFYRCLMRGDREFSDGMRRHVRGALVDSGLYRLSEGAVARSETITDSARTSFAMAFGITPATQRYIEDYYDNSRPGSGQLCPGLPLCRHFF